MSVCLTLMASIFESIPPLVIVKPIPSDLIPFVTDTPLPPEVIFPLTDMAAFYESTSPFSETPNSSVDLTLP